MRKNLSLAIASLILCSLAGPAQGQLSVPSATVSASDAARRIVGTSPGILGCPASGSKQTIGAGVGGLVGGLIGNRIAKGSRTIGTVVGGAAGAAAGSWIGCKLQINDQRKAQTALTRAASEGKPQQWASADTGVSGNAIPLINSQLRHLNFPQSVLPVANYDARRGNFIANRRANLRSSPSLESELVGILNLGENVDVVAGATDTPWLLVAENGTARGYVSEPLLTSKGPFVGQGCRTIRQSIATPIDAASMQDFKACPDGKGGWTITGV